MKTIIFIITLFMSVLASANLSDKIDELLTVSGTDHALNKESLIQLTEQALDSLALRDKLSPEATKKMKTQALQPIKKMNMGTLRTKIYDIYLDVYTEAEIDALILFYKSPIGAKVVQKSPFLTSEIQKATMEEMTKHLPARK